MRVHGLVLAQRSAYFERLLVGAGASMSEGRGKALTVELDDEQGQSMLMGLGLW